MFAFICAAGAFLMTFIALSAHEQQATAGRFTWLVGAIPAVIFLIAMVTCIIAAIRAKD